jgi:hypothetical protein
MIDHLKNDQADTDGECPEAEDESDNREAALADGSGEVSLFGVWPVHVGPG